MAVTSCSCGVSGWARPAREALNVTPVTEDIPRAAEEDQVELIDYLQVLWSHRWLIGLGTLAVMGAAVLVTITTPKTYQASLLLKVGTVFTPGKDGGGQLDVIEDPKTIVQVMTADATLDKFRTFLNNDAITLSGLRSAVKVKAIKSDVNAAATNLLELTLTLQDPHQVIEGLNFLASQVIDEHRSQYQAWLAVIDREQESLRENIRLSTVQHENLQKQVGELHAQMAVQRMEYENRLVQLAVYRARSENTKIRSAPVLPTVPVGPRRGLIVMTAGLLGAGAFVLAAFFLEYVRNARRRRDFSREFFST